MDYEFSLAHLTVLQCTPPEMIDIAAKSDYPYVSFRITPVTDHEPVYPLMDDRKMMKETKTRLADTGIRVLDIELVRMYPDTEPENYLSFLEACGELDARSIIAQVPDSDRKRAADRIARLCDLAKPFGLAVDLEFLPWTENPDIQSAASIIEAANRPNAGILLDTLHFNRSRCRLEDLKKLPHEWFHFVHLCDARGEIPETKEGLIHTARHDRYFPGEGDLDLREILDCIPKVPYSLEIPNDRIMKELGPEEVARRAIKAARKYLAS